MPRPKSILFAGAAVLLSGGLSLAGGTWAAQQVERNVMDRAAAALAPEDLWLSLVPSGTILGLEGEAPSEMARTAVLARLAAAGLGVRIDDRTVVGAPGDAGDDLAPAAMVNIDILVDGPEITLFGEVPVGSLQSGHLADLARRPQVSNMLAPVPGSVQTSWDDALTLALEAASLIDRGRITATATAVKIEGSVASDADRQAALDTLESAVPDSVALTLNLAAPRVVITPYAFRATLDDDGLTVARCALPQAADVARVAAFDPTAQTTCRIGLGAPSADWTATVVAALGALQEAGGGSVELQDVDITLVGPEGADAESFDSVAADFGAAIPPLYSLSASLPQTVAQDTQNALAPPRFSATRLADGTVRLAGDLPDERVRESAQAVAEAHFGFDTVLNQTDVRRDLPSGWSGYVVAGLEALGMLNQGALELHDGSLRLEGTAPSLKVEADVRATLAATLPSSFDVTINLTEGGAAVASTGIAVPAELCAEQIAILLAGGQIVFPPSETEIDETSLPIIDRIAEILGYCPGARFEIAGHTDSQGRESSNMALSQDRADAVLSALLERGIDTVFLSARGYGESTPIADNSTEDGRALNRRISFELLTEQPLEATAEELALDTAPDAGALSPDQGTPPDAADLKPLVPSDARGVGKTPAIPRVITRSGSTPLSDITQEIGAPPLSNPDETIVSDDDDADNTDADSLAEAPMRPLPRPDDIDG